MVVRRFRLTMKTTNYLNHIKSTDDVDIRNGHSTKNKEKTTNALSSSCSESTNKFKHARQLPEMCCLEFSFLTLSNVPVFRDTYNGITFSSARTVAYTSVDDIYRV